MNTFDFVKVFGVLFDNAIEAASLCDEKLVDIHVNIDFYNRKQVFTIKNTYIDKNIDTEKIFEKDFSTKEKKSGFGLWEVKQLLKKHKNVNFKLSHNQYLYPSLCEHQHIISSKILYGACALITASFLFPSEENGFQFNPIR
jgi:two-component system sensor histidine kinase AgrC